MITGKKRIMVVVCNDCRRETRIPMVSDFVSFKVNKDISECTKCGGKDFTVREETEVITK